MPSSRETMLARIRASLRETRAQLDQIAAAGPQAAPPFVHPAQDDLAAQFAGELARLEGQPHRCADDAAALACIGDILQSRPASPALCWDADMIGLPGLAELLASLGIVTLDPRVVGAERAQRLQALDPVAVCISGAAAGVAESGTLALLGGPGRGRLASLIAPVHIAVLRTGQLVRGLGEALTMLQSAHPDMFAASSSLTLITGPSRTADIEMTLTLGVHGPREVHAVLIG